MRPVFRSAIRERWGVQDRQAVTQGGKRQVERERKGGEGLDRELEMDEASGRGPRQSDSLSCIAYEEKSNGNRDFE
jgi:hypothetical protein